MKFIKNTRQQYYKRRTLRQPFTHSQNRGVNHLLVLMEISYTFLTSEMPLAQNKRQIYHRSRRMKRLYVFRGLYGLMDFYGVDGFSGFMGFGGFDGILEIFGMYGICGIFGIC